MISHDIHDPNLDIDSHLVPHLLESAGGADNQAEKAKIKKALQRAINVRKFAGISAKRNVSCSNIFALFLLFLIASFSQQLTLLHSVVNTMKLVTSSDPNLNSE